MPKPNQAAPSGSDLVEARVLSDCALGKWGEVIKVERSLAESSALLDPHPDAVAYAKAQQKTE